MKRLPTKKRRREMTHSTRSIYNRFEGTFYQILFSFEWPLERISDRTADASVVNTANVNVSKTNLSLIVCPRVCVFSPLQWI